MALNSAKTVFWNLEATSYVRGESQVEFRSLQWPTCPNKTLKCFEYQPFRLDVSGFTAL